MEEEGSKRTLSSAAGAVHTPPLHGGSDGFSVFISVLVILVLPLLCIKVFFVDLDYFVILCCCIYH